MNYGVQSFLKTPKNCHCISLVWPHLPFRHPRTILLMMVAICLNACILLEQPAQSFFEYYPRFRDLVQMLQHHGGRGAVSWHNTPQVPNVFAKVPIIVNCPWCRSSMQDYGYLRRIVGIRNFVICRKSPFFGFEVVSQKKMTFFQITFQNSICKWLDPIGWEILCSIDLGQSHYIRKPLLS